MNAKANLTLEGTKKAWVRPVLKELSVNNEVGGYMDGINDSSTPD